MTMRPFFMMLALCTCAAACTPAPAPIAFARQASLSCPSGSTLYSGLADTNDIQIVSSSPSSTYCTQTALNAGSGKQALIAFDLSSVPSTYVVTAAQLNLTSGVPTLPSRTVTVSTVTAPWTCPSWTSFGGAYGAPTATGTSPSTNLTPYAIDITSLFGTVRPTNGVLLDASGPVNIFSRRYGTASYRPTLDVCAAPPAGPTCTDGIKNGAETDIDCGGGTCPACAAGKGCAIPGDCTTANCVAGICQYKSQGTACGSGAQCSSGFCATGVCCNTACAGTCQGCTATLTGSSDGTCASYIAGTAAPAGQCSAAPPCGNDGKCAAGGTCEQTSAGTSCGAPACSSATLTPAPTCDGSGSCANGTPGACPGGLVCASSTACLSACSTDADCASSSTYCASGACASKGSTGAMCSAPDQCLSGICSGGFCAAFGCFDGMKDGAETDVDCGGGTCAACADGKQCLVASDCLSTSECDPWDLRCHPLGGQAITPVTSGSMATQDMTLTPTTIAYGSDPAQVFDRWAQPGIGPNAGARCELIVHEGGGTGGDKSSAAMVEQARMRASSGVGSVAIVPNYRLASGTPPNATNIFPAAIDDLRGLLAWLNTPDPGNPGHTNGETLGCSMSRIVWTGKSQGSIYGAIVALTTDGQDVTSLPQGTTLVPQPLAVGLVKAVILYYGAYDFRSIATVNNNYNQLGGDANLLTLCNATSWSDPAWTKCSSDLSAVTYLRPTGVKWLLLHAVGNRTTTFGDVVLFPSQSYGTAAYPNTNGSGPLTGFGPQLQPRSNWYTGVPDTLTNDNHMFDTTQNISSNWTAQALANSF